MRDLSRCVHHPAVSQEGFASLAVPTCRASTIVFPDAEAYANRKYRGPDGYSYGLHGTPTTRTLEAQLSALHGAERTVLLPSGQAAITVVLLSVLLPGDRVLIPDTAYPPVRGFCQNYLRPRGIDFAAYDPMIGAGIARLMTPRTKLVWLESPGSTTMEVQDFRAIATAAHAGGALVGCDNTWATPLLFKPLDHGADFAMEALTKYVGGHSDLLLGSVSVRDLGLRQTLKDTMRMLGIGISPDEAALALRGLETMGVRLAHVGRVALDFARRLEAFPAARRVLHPALPACPGHAVWSRDFKGASGVFSVVLPPEVEPVLGPALSAMRLFAIGASWGGTRSLVAPMTVAADRSAVPWTEAGTILRLSIGLEDPDELWDDLATLFEALGAALPG
ncbi:putative cystathionine beta-lyase [Rhodovastum atsumiense]|uniref:Aminotransferase class I/II-fold pyridoxal phosphate-dependent enzyme n=1 Tax=Rhodovastum atsumiense TaxID=504468 RepID=A0A5M6IN78_9PROT|nr:aminotransferase class I/II-fold pyridoxal phosphate-dependent enzyme [Rhodovastum atsumiense]KAA5609447.1 aminotransferase class I/II-fold pyridoxal phosphate-dependent enzyme [Rhodovastum atsumiense]CAH2603527.1 putative cystathionine beta-lyase [Rhodovastum atsumiense]